MKSKKMRKSVLESPFQGARHFDELHVYVDGAARGNPGPGGIGVLVLTREGRKVAAFGEAVGEVTNNFAEYMALVHALRLLSVFEVDRVHIYTDSELVASQVKGDYRVKEKMLRSLCTQALSMLRRYREWDVVHIPREKNAEADLLANRAVDEGVIHEKGPRRKGPPPPEGHPRLFSEG